jgi:hypothetical protein
MPWIVEWADGAGSSGPYETEWEAERYGCTESRSGRRGFRVVDLTQPSGLTLMLLDPRLAGPYWSKVAEYLWPQCDRFWVHWSFRPPNDKRSLSEQLFDPGGAPPAEPLPPRGQMELKRFDPVVDALEHSWICPNGVAATGPLTRDTLALLLKREDIRWWDLHLYSSGRRLFVATDGGAEHFARVSAEDVDCMISAGMPRTLFRAAVVHGQPTPSEITE